MRRIPFQDNENGVWDNLIDAPETKSPRTEGRADGTVFGIAPDPNEARTPDGMRRILMDGFRDDALPPHELAYFVERLMVFVTSCDERRFGEWEHTSWWDFIKAEDKSDEYKKVLARGLTRAVVAAKERKASTRTIGNMGEAFVYCIMGRGNDGAADRVLNAPTNEAWINPWVKLLRKQGVRFHVGHRVEALRMRGGEVESARAVDRDGRRHTIEADWFVSAMPAERARRLWSPAVLRKDESLKLMDELYVDWMNGIQYYLKKPFHVVRGHLTFIDAPWAVTALTQAQFWADRDFKRDYGNGDQVDSFSVDISDWDTPGIIYGKPAKECTPKQVAKEVLRADQAAPERQRRGHPHRRHGRLVAPGPGDQVVAQAPAQLQRRAAAREHRRHVGEAPHGEDGDPRTCSCRATTCRPTWTWRRWRARTSPAAPRSTRCSRRRARRPSR